MSPWLSDVFLASQSDERLVGLARAGHDQAFVAIAARYKRQLVGLARRLGAGGGAEDVVQQALMSALTALRAGAEVRHVRGWLHEIVRHAALKAAARAPIEGELSQNIVAADDPEEEVERRLLLRTTLAAIAVLPESQRDALVKTAVQGRSRTEVALSMGLSEGAVRQLVYRARASLRTGVTALTPYPIAVWATGARSTTAADRMAEIVLGAGSGSAGALALKTGAVVVATGVLATTLAVSPSLPSASHHAHRGGGELKAPRVRASPAPGASARAMTAAEPGFRAVSYRTPSRSSRPATAAPRPGPRVGQRGQERGRHSGKPEGAGSPGASAGEEAGKSSPVERPVTPESSSPAEDVGKPASGAPGGGVEGTPVTTSSDGTSRSDATSTGDGSTAGAVSIDGTSSPQTSSPPTSLPFPTSAAGQDTATPAAGD